MDDVDRGRCRCAGLVNVEYLNLLHSQEEQKFWHAYVYVLMFHMPACNIHGIMVSYALNDSLVILVLWAVDSIILLAIDGWDSN